MYINYAWNYGLCIGTTTKSIVDAEDLIMADL